MTKRDDAYVVRTQGADGDMHDYEVAYVFGVTPLQQYLVAFPDGRYQTLPTCWDTRPTEEGGQRWFHIYPDEPIPPGDELHWTGLNQNWNYMCAECHSTNLQKGYDPERGTYATTWSEIDVSCEACHGPGSTHVAWAEAAEVAEEQGESIDDAGEGMGLVLSLRDDGRNSWVMDSKTGIAERQEPPPSSTIIDTCARCHARRTPIAEPYAYGRPFLDTHRPALLTERLYHADGQILDEVYVYGSFIQSKMHAAGVTCMDCHDAHTLEVYYPDNRLCARCHEPERFDVPEHHGHPADSTGASCVACHMPDRNYMVVDPRHDHSMRVPRPDLTIELGVPNACNQCHPEESAEWALESMEQWYGSDPRQPHYGSVLHAARAGRPGSDRDLAALARDTEQPGIVRATALSMLGPSAETPGAVRAGAGDPDPLVRMGAASAGEVIEPRERVGIVAPLLGDPVRGVRVEAARALADVPDDLLTEAQRTARWKSTNESIAGQMVNADHPTSRLNIGLLYLRSGRFADAEVEYLAALRLEPAFVPAVVNLADLYRGQQREADAERVLREALEAAPDSAPLRHSLGLCLIRQKRSAEATVELGRAALLAPEQPRYGFVHAISLHTAGLTAEAISVLLETHDRHPRDADVLLALTTIFRDAGLQDEAVRYARKLVELVPDEPAYRELLTQVEGER
jgi:Tfp pilus assembly protein PilF